ncbi:MAE_28990/MAE_18760 family HEPN-like nuclease [Neorhizobium galegae]|uniref:MAE_28990/MAE_18760 family HEPN-like nuclease n=1 Tax=Neorhizobium galegae TaxID=399 RepID=UPI002106AAA5|nr:MAE_28990/MAE_18760 family HEPN-like nuclease [Neorhizobium galegae]MCQ1773704.1 MAE_28990/MAE_18760 family HEPN-like nuclease [Neorhizobium galegae]MCQ1799731.1 MAE_28990/MAE_18760 family HEPN-like nuclease [Neorhizobium galegae]
MPGILETAFDERLNEVMAYLAFLDELEAAILQGAPRFGETGAAISPQQTHILRAGVFVQLYNLVEATMTRCLEALAAASTNGAWVPGDLTPAFRKEWVKVVVAANKDLNAENRLRHAVTLTELLVTSQPLQAFKIEKGGGGNWNDTAIEEILDRLGLRLVLAPQVRSAAKRPVRDQLGPLALVVKLRNDLAHGSISFKECGENETVGGLRQISQNTAMYLRSVVRAVERSIERHEFLTPERRPVPA